MMVIYLELLIKSIITNALLARYRKKIKKREGKRERKARAMMVLTICKGKKAKKKGGFGRREIEFTN
jgi:hypothetical protein